MLGDDLLRQLLDPAQGPVDLGFYRAVQVGGQNRLAYLSTRRGPEAEPLYRAEVWQEPIPLVHRLSKNGALKLIESMKDQRVWVGTSPNSLAEAIEQVRWIAGGLEGE